MREAGDVSGTYGGFRDEPPLEVAIARLAERQHGVLALGQLRALGLRADAVHKRAAGGRLHRVHRRVYAVGHRGLTERGWWMAAVLACGREAVLSHRSAGAHWGLRSDRRSKTDVSVPRRSGRSRGAIVVHWSPTLRPEDVGVHEGIPCTSVARTLLDLADVLDSRSVERAVERAEVLRLFDGRAVADVLARAGPRRGAGVLRSVLAGPGGETLTANDLEEDFLEICRGAALPQPAVNTWLAVDGDEFKADFLWPNERLVVETDGRASHGTRRAFEEDRRRDQRLMLAGFRVLRFTHRQVTDEPERVAQTIGALLGR